MYHRWCIRLAVVAGLLAACDAPTEVVTVGLRVDLTPCLGALDAVEGNDRDSGTRPVVSTCRDNLDLTVADAMVNACFVAAEIADGARARRLPLQWTGGQLLEPFPDRHLDLPLGRRWQASIFFLATGDETGVVCDDFEVATPCEGSAACVLKLHQVEVTPLADGSTTFDFTIGEGANARCDAETGGAFGASAVEQCDGMDNDCDRVVDEDIPGADLACDVGVGACNATGATFCDPTVGMVVCSAIAGAPGDEARPADEAERCAVDDGTCCDGVDDDCDGVTDEDIDCSPCAADEDCAENIAGQQCVGGLCEACDPGDHAGCQGAELCCAAGGRPACEPVSFGPGPEEQCAACDAPCVVIRDVPDGPDQRIQSADSCAERQCLCGIGPACAEPAPFCLSGQCVECLGNRDCGPQELCCDGQCQPTSPDGQCGECGLPCNGEIANRCVDRQCRCGESELCIGARATCVPDAACDGSPDDPACSPRNFECEECLEDVDCIGEPTDQACVDRQCRECKDNVDLYCTNNAGLAGRPECVESDCYACDRRNHDGCAEDGDAPFCDADDNACRACVDDAECRLRPGDRDQCVDGRCVVCNPDTYAGCNDANAAICDGATRDCRPCRSTDECNANAGPGGLLTECIEGRCRGCNPERNQGCDAIGPTPICSPDTLVCRGCIGDQECPAVAPGSPEDDDRDGAGPIAPASASDYCVDRQCRECDPEGHLGCAEAGARPICRAGNCDACERDADCNGRPGDLDQCIPDGAAAGRCKLCDPADNAGCDDPANPVCDPQSFTCQPCGLDAECNRGRDPGLAPVACVDGACTQCDPRPGQLNAGCDPLSDVPFCDAERSFCRRCATASECVRLDTERGLDVELFGCVGGDCTECDPGTQIGCPDTQVCDFSGRCRACTVDAGDPLNRAGDAECALGDGPRDQCVAGRCEVCDPVDFTGCDPHSGAPVCDADDKTCRGCGPDAECRAGQDRPASPVGPECVAGFCRVCDPSAGARNAGCDPVGAAPYCDPGLFNCAPCGTGVEGDDARCADNPRAELEQCIGQRCAECDPNNHDGCAQDDPDPFCDPGRATCRTCDNDAECFIRPGNRDQCVGGACVVCDPADDAGCNNPNQPVCGANSTCRPCETDDECPGALLCDAGRCVQCDPDTHRGCDLASGAPFCDPGNSTCRACTLLPEDVAGGQRDTECVAADLPQCVRGNCNACDPDTHDGCDESGPTPFCGANGVCRACGDNAECVLRPGSLDYCSAGACVQCNRDTEAGCPGDRPVCDDGTQSCRTCRNSGECVGAQECVDGTCVGCAPGTNEGCDPGSIAPVCDGVALACRGCAADAECNGNPNGDQCYADRCVQCDPSGAQQVGCDVTGAAPFCANHGACRGCQSDAECVIAPGNRDQCVGTRCEQCDPAGNAGCDPTSATPICGGNQGNRRCVACQNDGQCNGNPNGNQCVAGACVQCDPANDDGCDPNGSAPECDAQSKTCGACQNDGQCNGNPNGNQCVDGACEQCDPANADGCVEASDTPICNAATKRCQRCTNPAECTLRPGDLDVCVAPACKECDPGTNLGCGGQTPICDNGDRCVGCTRDAECGPGIQCLPDGSCAGCNPLNNSGCLADNPICDDGTRLCRPCRDDGECGGGFCFAGRCEVCDPEGHAGCGANQLCCQSGDIFACAQTNPDTQCAACGVACDADGDSATDGSNACADRTCRCGGLVECDGDQPYCLGARPDGICSECRDNGDCAANSDDPICGADIGGGDTNTCRGCANDDECRQHPRGAQCVDTGACQVCDPDDDAGCIPSSNRPICDGNFACRGCQNDGECASNPANGGQCVNSHCTQCDPTDDAGCDPASPTPACIAGNVCGCADDGDCAGNPNGTQCVGGVCAQCDPAAVNSGQANGGCNLGGNAPYCEPHTQTCVGCGNDDNRCTNNPNGALCDGNRCEACLVGSNDGCNADELCCGGNPTCQPADEDACTACQGGACDPETANACDDRQCLCGANPACQGGLLCDGGVCVECATDVDCPGEICVAGTCQVCEQGNNRGCTSSVPICLGNNTCGACDPNANGNAQCAADPDYGDYCVLGACAPCVPTGHLGCAADELCCNQGPANGGIQCVPTDDGRCTACNFGGCGNGESCNDQRQCVDG